jgi:hypothetical protein
MDSTDSTLSGERKTVLRKTVVGGYRVGAWPVFSRQHAIFKYVKLCALWYQGYADLYVANDQKICVSQL